MKFNLDRAIARSTRRDALRQADESARWVIRKRKMLRIPSASELCSKHSSETLTCFHGNSYTMPCKNCKRSKEDASLQLNRIKAMLSII